MAVQFVFDFLGARLVLVDVPAGSGTITPPTPSYFIPIFFNLIPQ